MPVLDPAAQADEKVPKQLCQMDNHLACVNCVRYVRQLYSTCFLKYLTTMKLPNSRAGSDRSRMVLLRTVRNYNTGEAPSANLRALVFRPSTSVADPHHVDADPDLT